MLWAPNVRNDSVPTARRRSIPTINPTPDFVTNRVEWTVQLIVENPYSSSVCFGQSCVIRTATSLRQADASDVRPRDETIVMFYSAVGDPENDSAGFANPQQSTSERDQTERNRCDAGQDVSRDNQPGTECSENGRPESATEQSIADAIPADSYNDFPIAPASARSFHSRNPMCRLAAQHPRYPPSTPPVPRLSRFRNLFSSTETRTPMAGKNWQPRTSMHGRCRPFRGYTSESERVKRCADAIRCS